MEKRSTYSLLNRLNPSDEEIGSPKWWEDICNVGTPLITDPKDGNCQVLFLWQDPQGNETESKTQTVLLDVNSITDHHSWTPLCLERLNGTNLWFAQLTIHSHWRGSYSFIPIEKEKLPDVVRASGDGSVQAQREWWLDVAKGQMADPLNRLPTSQSGWGTSSPLHLPDAPVEVGWKEWELGFLDLTQDNQVQVWNWESSSLGNQRECWLFSTATRTAPLIILLDGQRWGASSGTLSVLHYLTDIGKISPAHYLMISSINGETRWQELGCYHPFWESVMSELLPRVEKMIATSGQGISEYLIAGQSLGGLSALYAAVNFPDIFSKIISLSGSFWWPDKSLMMDAKNGQVTDFVPKHSMAEQISSDKVSASHLHIYQSVGTGEEDMCGYNEATFHAIQQKGGTVKFEKVCGGHDWLSWRSGIVNGLMYLIPANPISSLGEHV